MNRILICLLTGVSLTSTLNAMQQDNSYDLTVATHLIIGEAVIHSKMTEHAIYPYGLKLKGWEETKEQPHGHFVDTEIKYIVQGCNTLDVIIEYSFNKDEKTVLFSDTVKYNMLSTSAVNSTKKVPGYKNVAVIIEVKKSPYLTK